MKIQAKELPFHHILVEKIYSEEELDWVWKELDLLSRDGVFENADKTESAISEKGEYLKKNLGVFLDGVYAKRETSAILSFNRKLFDAHLLNQPTLWFFKHLEIIRDFTLLSYYENGNYYQSHSDHATATALTWFYREPKKFDGGELYFPEYDYTVVCRTNSAIVFPSQIKHAVTPIQMVNFTSKEKWGRYCMAQFLHAA